METLNIIYKAIDEINLELDESQKIEKSEDTQLFGTGKSLDSLELVNFITIIEQLIEEETGNFVSLADERAMSMDESPFKTVESLNNYIMILLNDNNT